MLRLIRNFFYSEKVLEVVTPSLRLNGSSESHLDNISVGNRGYLQTSPEYGMKCLLVEHQCSMFQICAAFRAGETGRLHQEEFQILEWYRCEYSLLDLMEDFEALLAYLTQRLEVFGIQRISQIVDRFSYQELFEKYYGINPHSIELGELVSRIDAEYIDHLNETSLLSDYLDAAFSSLIQPNLLAPTIVYDYPKAQAALAEVKELSTGDSVSDRFEFYLNGVEIANAYQELRDRKELELRFSLNNEQRKMNGKPLIEDDLELLSAIDRLPKCAGIAMGIDRLIMVLRGIENITEV